MKSKLMTTKIYTVKLTAHAEAHKYFYELIKRWLYIEGRKVESNEIEVKNV